MRIRKGVKSSVPSNLVGWWKFNEGPGLVAQDYSGSGNHGRILDGAYINRTLSNGQTVSAYDLSTSGVEIPHSASFDVGQLSILMWIKTPASHGAGWRNLFSKSAVDRDYNFYTYSSDGIKVTHLHLSSVPFGSTQPAIPIAYSIETWHLVGVSIGNGANNYKYYSDGQNFASFTSLGGTANNNYTIRIGMSDNFYDNPVQDVRFYNTNLSDTEHLKIYNDTL